MGVEGEVRGNRSDYVIVLDVFCVAGWDDPERYRIVFMKFFGSFVHKRTACLVLKPLDCHTAEDGGSQ